MSELVPVQQSQEATVAPIRQAGHSDDAVTFAQVSHRLARNLFDAGLRLDSLHEVFEQNSVTAAELRTASTAVGTVLNQLDAVLRETGLFVPGPVLNWRS